MWSLDPDRTFINDYTCKPRKRGSTRDEPGIGGLIVDRIAISRIGQIHGHVQTMVDDFVPATDHRAIWGEIAIGSYDLNQILRRSVKSQRELMKF